MAKKVEELVLPVEMNTPTEETPVEPETSVEQPVVTSVLAQGAKEVIVVNGTTIVNY